MFEVKNLLEPISDQQLCGDDLSFSREIDAIVEARRFDDPSLDQGEWVTEMKSANWPFVIEQCSSLIASKSKDLRLAVWLTEASAKIDHFAGLAEGYLLLAGLCNQFWECMHPLPDHGDQEQRIGNLHWILTRSIALLKEMPLTEGRGTAYSQLDFEAARARAENADKLAMEGKSPEEGPKLTDLEYTRRKNSRKFNEKLLHDAQYCLAALQQLERAVDARLGMDGPGFSAAKESIENALSMIARFAQDSGGQTMIHGSDQSNTRLQSTVELLQQSGTQTGSQTAQQSSNGALQTRDQALAQLRSVAVFFRRTEPHSPVAYLADKAVHWGEMSLHTWLNTVIKDPGSLAHVEELLGLKLPPDSNKY
ncbi:MAG: type VI secretion system protein TssA [Undibacterium sp.]|nr:type VI secretion system protein TssA [Undibacterium sp.]MDO8652949.1 type VI secretion system protein TssA [Undibacterium sp.]